MDSMLEERSELDIDYDNRVRGALFLIGNTFLLRPELSQNFEDFPGITGRMLFKNIFTSAKEGIEGFNTKMLIEYPQQIPVPMNSSYFPSTEPTWFFSKPKIEPDANNCIDPEKEKENDIMFYRYVDHIINMIETSSAGKFKVIKQYRPFEESELNAYSYLSSLITKGFIWEKEKK
jgi:hypothetical protein